MSKLQKIGIDRKKLRGGLRYVDFKSTENDSAKGFKVMIEVIIVNREEKTKKINIYI